ncbi:MAG: exodeoxyribonuclease VII small subunit [Patescibacteria group bacterium]|mgnify:CR=1 FL=1
MTKDISFNKALARLEEIVDKLEDPNLDLEEGLKLLEEGVKLHKLCKSKLMETNAKITTILKENNENSQESGVRADG